MQLKGEFKDAIISLSASKPAPAGAPASSAPEIKLSINPEIKLYELLQTNEGFLALQEYFLRSLNEPQDEGGSKSTLLADEFAFSRMISGLLDNVDEIYLLDTFDTIDPKCNGAIGFKEFYLYVLLWAAKEEGGLSYMLYMNGQRLYEIIAGGQEVVATERVLRFGRILGFKEELLLESLEQILGKEATMSNCEDFVTFYYYLFEQYDQAFEKYKTGKAVKSSGKEESVPKHPAPRVQGGCCTAKVCTIF